ncbi:MAG: helix-turn-helix domain-containing protein [Bryobacteraceae bacterium]|nr:helix-turn-helix domain-containing protein [Bryobacteraceae bacterium]
MDIEKKKRLQRNGWAVGSATDFLQLSPEEASFIELKLALAAGIRELRQKNGLTQTEVAAWLGSSQSRVAKMEAGDRSVSLDLLVKSLLRIGASPTAIAKWIRRAETNRAA